VRAYSAIAPSSGTSERWVPTGPTAPASFRLQRAAPENHPGRHFPEVRQDRRYHGHMAHTRERVAGPAPLYQDRWIECTPDALVIRGYYFPLAGRKVVPYRSIRSVQSFQMGVFTGRGRIWGTTNPRYWAHLDPGRPHKTVGLLLDLGRFVKPAITPDDPAAVEAILRERLAS
jgi:hypothetical protein